MDTIDARINRKSFKGKFYKDIENGLINKYKQLYPENDIEIKYSSDQSIYYFRVYISGKRFNLVNDQLVVEDYPIFVTCYNNANAIKAFSTIPWEDFDNEYNDYKKDNYKIVKDGIDKLASMYKLLGVEFDSIDIHESYCFIYFHSENERYQQRSYRKCFDITPISESTAKNTVRDFKKTLEYYYNNKYR
jgi:hypothetical protein